MRRLLLSLVLASACGEDAMTPPSMTKCGGATFDTYAAGLKKTSAAGAFEATLVESSLAPPDRGANTFTFAVTELPSGAAVAPERLEVRPWMPQHGHGATPESYSATGTAERAVVGPIELFMPGLWEIRVSLKPQAERAVFTFCVEG